MNAILNTSMRCDACHAQARVVIILKRSRRLPRGGQLLFCNHCRRTNWPILEPLVAQVIDETE